VQKWDFTGANQYFLSARIEIKNTVFGGIRADHPPIERMELN
jgi:hypothetical protein